MLELLERRRLLTVLTFDPAAANGVVLPAGYGSRVDAASQGGFTYGTAGSLTPNVAVNFGPSAANVRQWTTGYGDLSNVIFAGDAANGILEITFTADLGFQASLNSLDLAGGNANFSINSISVLDGANNQLFTQSPTVKGTPGNHTTINFGGIHSRVLRIRIDASNLGSNGDQIAVDNIQFSQTNGASPIGDGYADVVLAYHNSGAGPIKGPYGGNTPDESATPVSAGVVLGADPQTPDYLSLPTGSFVTVGFADETIVDGPGNDLAVSELVDTGERARVYVSSDLVNYTILGTAKAGRLNKFDLASIGYKDPVRAVKVLGLDNNGGSPGFDLENVQAIAGSMRPETFRFPIGNGTDLPTISKDFGSNDGLLGQEYATPVGKNVFPFMWGRVFSVISGDAELGDAVIIGHTLLDGTKIYSLYAHLSKVLVVKGDLVSTDTKIALTGDTGDSTSPNLRVGIFQGDPSAAGLQFDGTTFASSLESRTDINGVIHFNPSKFIIGSDALSIGFAAMPDPGAITINGTAGNDALTLSAADGRIAVNMNGITRFFDQSITHSISAFMTSGDDRATVSGAIIGSYIDGGPGNDLLSGGDGKDTLTGSSGKNTLLGNGGDDRLNGSGSHDSIDGGDGNDRLYGNDGDDTLTGNAGVDRLFGGNGNDSLAGGSSNDKLYGEAGDDTLLGNNQNDSMEGGAGNDSLVGGSGADTLRGNDGNDVFDAHDGTVDLIDGGAGANSARLDAADLRTNIQTLL